MITGASWDLSLLLLFQTLRNDLSHQMVGSSRELASPLSVADTYLRLGNLTNLHNYCSYILLSVFSIADTVSSRFQWNRSTIWLRVSKQYIFLTEWRRNTTLIRICQMRKAMIIFTSLIEMIYTLISIISLYKSRTKNYYNTYFGESWRLSGKKKRVFLRLRSGTGRTRLPPKDVHTLIPRMCEYVTFHGKMTLLMWLSYDMKMRIFSWII